MSPDTDYDYIEFYHKSVLCKVGLLNIFDYHTDNMDNYFYMTTTSGVGSMIFVGLVLPAVCLSPITVVGKICIDIELIKSKTMPEWVIFPLLSSKSCIALIPLGVAALPSPRIFELKFIAIYLSASLLFVLKSFFIIGERKLDNFSPRPHLSTILIIPSHTA